MSDVKINDKQLDLLIKRLEKAKNSNNPIQKQQKIVLNKLNSQRVQNVRRAIKPFSRSKRLAKSVKYKAAYYNKQDNSVKGRVYYGYQEFFDEGLRYVKRGQYDKRGRLTHYVSQAKGVYYAHIPEYGRRDGNYQGRHFLWSSDNGISDISEYQKALEKGVEKVLLY